jgi:Rrf2 family iron-sulfur cluster assembly transcriptional regulator
MLLPQTAEYALRAVVHVARHAEAGPVRVPTMAAALALPRNYLSKTLHQLARAGVLASARGPAGGFRLAVPADALTLDRIVAVFGDTGARRCLLADRPCGQDPGCPVHQRWAPVSARLHGFFRSTTVADLVAGGAPDVAAVLAGDAPAGFPAPPSPGPTTGPRA